MGETGARWATPGDNVAAGCCSTAPDCCARKVPDWRLSPCWTAIRWSSLLTTDTPACLLVSSISSICMINKSSPAGIARPAKGDGISGLAQLKAPGNAEIDEVKRTRGRQHDIGRFEVTEDDGRQLTMQVIKHPTEADADFKHLLYAEIATCGLE